MSAPALEVDALADRLRRHEPSVAGDAAAIRVVRGPGRVNLIGEHTDYNQGYVLPAAIDLEIRIAFVPTADRHVAITLPETGERREFRLDAIPPASGQWIDYVAATAWSLQSAGLRLHAAEAHQRRDGRRRQLAGEDRAHVVDARELAAAGGELVRIRSREAHEPSLSRAGAGAKPCARIGT